MKEKPIKLCTPETCENCIALGEGDFACDKNDDYVLVMEDYEPTEKMLRCMEE